MRYSAAEEVSPRLDRKSPAEEREHLEGRATWTIMFKGKKVRHSDTPESKSFPTELCVQRGTCSPKGTWDFCRNSLGFGLFLTKWSVGSLLRKSYQFSLVQGMTSDYCCFVGAAL